VPGEKEGLAVAQTERRKLTRERHGGAQSLALPGGVRLAGEGLGQCLRDGGLGVIDSSGESGYKCFIPVTSPPVIHTDSECSQGAYSCREAHYSKNKPRSHFMLSRPPHIWLDAGSNNGQQ